MNNKNVIRFPASENFTPDLAIKHVLSLCEAGHVADILLVGYDDENDLITFSSHMTRAEAVFLLEKAKDWAINGGLE
jgi:hypothetical protein